MAPLGIAIVGLGYWGPNLARNFAATPGADVRWLCDADRQALATIGAAHPGVRLASSIDEVLDDEGVGAVVVATPVPTHADLAVRVLESGRHCFVEKPLAQS